LHVALKQAGLDLAPGVARWHHAPSATARGKHMPVSKLPKGFEGWERFAERVREAAKRQRPKSKGTPENLTAGPPSRLHPPRKRCVHVSRKSGARCKNWPMRGATRCHLHGGHAQVPDHPATIAHLQEIERQAEHSKHRQLVRDAPQEAREAAKAETKRRGLGAHNADLWQGIQAFQSDDGGRAWRRWLTSLDARTSKRPGDVGGGGSYG